LAAVRFCRIGLCAVLLLFTGYSAVSASPPESIRQKQSDLHALHERLRQKRQQLGFEKLRESDFKRQLSETSDSIAMVQEHLGVLQQRIAGLRRDRAHEQQRYALASAAFERQRNVYSKRLVEMYEHPAQDYWSVLVGATSFTDLAERVEDLRLLVAEDRRDVNARNLLVERIEAIRIALDGDFARLQAERRQETQTHEQLAALVEQRQDLVAMAGRQRQLVADQVTNLEEITAQEEAQLEAMIRQREAEPELPAPATGAMMWPVSGPVTSPFGMRPNPFGGGNMEFHPGIDIGVPVGTPVLAAAPGKIIIAGWVSGYGNYVAIDHGGGISTGYGHLSQIFVAVGQDVQRGQALGASGNTGRSTGPHLIFEVRRDGTPIDPNPFLGG